MTECDTEEGLNERMDKKGYCKRCYHKFEEKDFQEGFCTVCAEEKYKTMKKMLIICTVVGGVFVVVFFLIVYFTQLRHNGYFYGTESGFRIYYTFLTMEASTAHLVQVILFFLPFGVGVTAKYLPYVDTGEEEGNFVITLLKWVICTVLAPIFIIYMVFHMLKLKDYINR